MLLRTLNRNDSIFVSLQITPNRQRGFPGRGACDDRSRISCALLPASSLRYPRLVEPGRPDRAAKAATRCRLHRTNSAMSGVRREATGQRSRLVDVVHLRLNHRRSMKLTKNESVCFGVSMTFKARSPRVVNSILRLVVSPESFESPSSRALVEA